ncbi:S8 family serine peptidase [Streptomyces cocklensis]|uniref:Serine protease, subtilisin family n=1 Tax=Actinacidiphila cocklensis TaxID=887465 RepID=A0A9W4GNH5_9ACTN|nr:S8 family serine peptidase [Actinacidiphila cocklensis]MDD1058406.1 S8 family serine peptidase [Actinacidiphila cocklensis]CAG6390552.1 Serine protease, subtilisin family [Actinacidiphila cocklensis]
MFPSSQSSAFRRRRSQLLSAAGVVPLLLSGLATLPAPAQAAPSKPTVPAKPSATHKVTLVTGDVVTVTTMADGKQTADVDRPKSAVGGVKIQEIKGDLFVIPDEAAPLLSTNKLDRRLFDVTDLIAMGYDDAKSAAVPLIAAYSPPKSRSVVEPTAPRGSKLTRTLKGIHGAALSTEKRQARTFWTAVAPQGSKTLGAGMSKLWLDGRVKANLKESVPLIGAPEAWAAGYTGKGVKVAVLDTGIDVNHPDFAGVIDGTTSFVPGEDVTDVNGHGTHVASTIVGSGAASGGDYKGVAPGADLYVGKVLGGVEGAGQDSWVMAGMQWAAESGMDIVSMSLGDSFPTDGTDPLSQTVDALSAQYGTLFVIAAGNAGPESISAPGAAASALTVAATDKQDQLASFSSTGPLASSGGMKPDIAAPGVDITAARSQEMTDGGEGYYRTLSGTSMATPHVAGAAAILAQQHPDWTGAQLKEHLMSTAKGLDDGYSPYEVGTGRVDVAAAVRTTVRGTGSLFFGNHTWPQEPSDAAVTKDLTFTNTGTADTTLNLALTDVGGPFTLGATTVTVPAGGTAAVPVTGDPQTTSAGRHVGYVIGTDAADGKPVTRTSVALLKEDERYDLNIKLVGRDGKPASGWVGINLAGDVWPWSVYVDGSTTMRMAPGLYTVAGYIDVAGEKPDRSGLAVLVDPEAVLKGGPADVVLDASKAHLLQTEAPQRTEDRQRKVDFNVHYDGFDPYTDYRSAYVLPPSYDDVYVSPTKPMKQGEFILTTRWRKGQPLLSLSALGGRLGFETLVQSGSALGTATDTLGAVYAGNGAAAAYEKVRAKGKVVVIERSDEVSPQERTDAAVAAGAKALIVVNDGAGALMEYVGESTVPVASVHRDEGRTLISMAKAGIFTMTVKQTQYTPFVYDLTRDYPAQVPDRALVYRPAKADLARIDARYYSATDGKSAEGYRSDFTLSPSFNFPEAEWHPGTRTEWVTPGQDWREFHTQGVDEALPWTMVSGDNTYAKGSTTRLDWFAPATRPAQGESFGVYNSRWQNFMTWNVQAWASASDNMRLGGYLPWGETPSHLQVFQGDTLISDNPVSGDMQWQEVPAGNLPYRAVLDVERPGDVFRLSTRTHSEWTFVSDTVDSDSFEPFSVLNLDYRLESDLHGDVKADATQKIALRPVSMDAGSVPGKVTTVKLDVSYDDGVTWQKVTLAKGADGYWTGSFRAAKKSGGFISLRASAATDRGFSVKNEITRAYGLR